MRKVILLAVAALAAGISQAGWESWLKSSIYRASCEEYDYGEPLSNEKGAEGGSWGVIPSGVAWAATARGYSQYIKFVTETTGIAFTPESIGDRPLKSVRMSMLLNGNEEYPHVPDTARGAFALHSPESGEAHFIGWTASGWQDLQADSIIPVSAQWYDVSMKFMQRTDGTVRVQYRLKDQTSGAFVTLHAVDDESAVWFAAGNGLGDGIVSKVEFQGDGAFRYVEGSEPRRGMLISLVPWREMIIDESVDRHGSGSWRVFDYDVEEWLDYPNIVDGDAYGIDVPEGENYVGFLPQTKDGDGTEVVEFSVRFTAPNENDATPNDVCALVRIVADPSSLDVRDADLGCRFACLVNGGWYTNTTIKADVDVDYTVEVSLDKKENKVSYRIRQGRGAEAGAYQMLVPSPVEMPIGSPLFTFFGGVGKVYSIKSSVREAK